MTDTLSLNDLIDGLGRTFVGRRPREPRVRRATALPEFQPRVLKLHDRYLLVMRKFRRGGTHGRRARFAFDRQETVIRALLQGWTIREILAAMEEKLSSGRKERAPGTGGPRRS